MSFLTLGQADLLDVERVVTVKNVSAIVSTHDYGLSPCSAVLRRRGDMGWRASAVACT